MKTQVKITAICAKGGTIASGWFSSIMNGEKYANRMVQRGYVVVKQYR